MFRHLSASRRATVGAVHHHITPWPAATQAVSGPTPLHAADRPQCEQEEEKEGGVNYKMLPASLSAWLLAGRAPQGPGFGRRPRSMWPKFKCELETVSRRGHSVNELRQCEVPEDVGTGPHVRWRSLMSSKWISRTWAPAPRPSCRPAAKLTAWGEECCVGPGSLGTCRGNGATTMASKWLKFFCNICEICSSKRERLVLEFESIWLQRSQLNTVSSCWCTNISSAQGGKALNVRAGLLLLKIWNWLLFVLFILRIMIEDLPGKLNIQNKSSK